MLTFSFIHLFALTGAQHQLGPGRASLTDRLHGVMVKTDGPALERTSRPRPRAMDLLAQDTGERDARLERAFPHG